MEKRNQAAKLIIGAVVVIIAIMALAGIVSRRDIKYKSTPLSREDISYDAFKNVEAPKATGAQGTITASDWATVSAAYKHIVASKLANDYKDTEDYLVTDKYLKNLYAGYGFAKDYKAAQGHEFTMQDVMATERTGQKSLANCLTCKTPDFTKLVNDLGISVYGEKFLALHEELTKSGAESVSCYNCHGNTPNVWQKIDPDKKDSKETNLTITHSYVTKALGEDIMKEIDPGVLACGQCHIEYYFDKDTKETTMPYHSVAEMTPEAIYAYYQSIGFADWTQLDEETGVGTSVALLKVQHPEMETFLAGKHAGSLSCADCHMPIVQDPNDQTIYHSHTLVSPLKDETLLTSCLACHKELGQTTTSAMITFVTNIQTRTKAREAEVGGKLDEFNAALVRATAAETADPNCFDEIYPGLLAEVREIYREAQWFFDFCYVENSEGAHNSDLAAHCLDTAEELYNLGMKKLGTATDLLALNKAIEEAKANAAHDPAVLEEAAAKAQEAKEKLVQYCADKTGSYAAACLRDAVALIKEANTMLTPKDAK